MNGLKIEPIDLLGSNEMGKTYAFNASQTEGYILAFRKEGSVSGNHYHKGVVKGKSPETLVLISGKCEVEVEHVEDGEVQKTEVEGPVKLSFAPYYFHTVKALTDLVFIELNSIEEHKRDTYYRS